MNAFVRWIALAALLLLQGPHSLHFDATSGAGYGELGATGKLVSQRPSRGTPLAALDALGNSLEELLARGESESEDEEDDHEARVESGFGPSSAEWIGRVAWNGESERARDEQRASLARGPPAADRQPLA